MTNPNNRPPMPGAYILDVGAPSAMKMQLSDASGWSRSNAGSYRELSHNDSDYARAYLTCVWAYAAINVMAQKIADVLARTPVKSRITGKELPEHPFRQAITLTFRYYQQEPFEEWTLNKYIFGEAFIEKVRAYPFGQDSFGIPSCLRVLNSLAVEPNVIHGAIKDYQYSGEDGNKTLPINSVLFDKFKTPSDDFRGYSKLGAALDAISTDIAVVLLAKKYLKNNARPGLIFTPKDKPLDETDEMFFRRILSDQAKGPNNAGRPLYLTFPMDITTVNPPTFEDQQYLSTDDLERICAVVGTPVGLVNYNNQKFQLSPEQRKGMYTEHVLPNAGKIARLTSEHLLPFFDPSGEAVFEVDEDREMDRLEDPAARTTRIKEQFTAGFRTFNAAREATGQEPVPGGDWFALPPGIVPVRADEMPGVKERYTSSAASTDFKYNDAGIPIPQEDVFQYHIEGGVADLNEARAKLGLPPKAQEAQKDDHLTRLQSQFNTMAAGIAAQLNPVVVAQMVGLQLPPDAFTAPAVPTLPGMQDGLQSIQTEPAPPVTGKALWVGLIFPNDPNLISLRSEVQRHIGNTPCRWNDPAGYHVTLLYAPAAADAQIAAFQSALAGMTFEPLELSIGSLRVFEGVGEYPLHFRIRDNEPLYELQEKLYEAAQTAGIRTSGYSDPNGYTPHVTMGYASSKPKGATFRGKLKVSPACLRFSVTDPDTRKDAVLFEKPFGEEPVKTITLEAQQDELRAWEKKTLHRGAAKAAPFVCNTLDAATARYVRAVLTWEEPATRDSIKALFAEAADLLALKAYGDTKRGFYDAVLAIIRPAQADESTRSQFGARMRSALTRWGLIAFRDGMNEGRYDPESFSKEELAVFRAWQTAQSAYVKDFGAEIFKAGITETEVSTRAQMWTNMSLDQIHQSGRTLATPDQRAVYRIGSTNEHCADCKYLDGKIATRKDWETSGWQPRSGVPERHACGQFHCECGLFDTDEPVNFEPSKYKSQG